MSNEHYRLYHYPICPLSRTIRVMLAYKSVPYIAVIENFWEKREKFCIINPTSEVPFLAIKRDDASSDQQTLLIFGINAIISYLEEKYTDNSLIFGTLSYRAEIRKMCEWFNSKFYLEVSKYIINERIYSWYKSQRSPDLQLIKLARLNLESHLNFLANILSKRDFVGCNDFSLADIVAACHISSLDYLGEINWQNYSLVKDWYSIIKSKPSFRDLLYDTLPGFKASAWYRELDF
jgi:glutathione S-transferase